MLYKNVTFFSITELKTFNISIEKSKSFKDDAILSSYFLLLQQQKQDS